jgi:hypothetical protein
MKNSKVICCLIVAVIAVIAAANPPYLGAQPHAASATSNSPNWSVQVAVVDPATANIEPSFQVAIYESLLEEMGKTKRFKQVFRDGDRIATGVPNLLVLKTTVQKYTAGSETQRAVTTVSGATKLSVQIQLCTREGQVLLERTVTGDVRFMGSNLKATQNLAHNVAKAIKKSSLNLSVSANG